MDPLDLARADVRQALFGGTGAVRVWSLAPAMPPFTAVLWCRLDGGGRVGAHRQATDDEMIVVVSGRAHVTVAGIRRELGPGGAAGLALGALLEIENADPDAAVDYLIVKARR